jgi:hypothetical protein
MIDELGAAGLLFLSSRLSLSSKHNTEDTSELLLFSSALSLLKTDTHGFISTPHRANSPHP